MALSFRAILYKETIMWSWLVELLTHLQTILVLLLAGMAVGTVGLALKILHTRGNSSSD